MGMGLSSVTLFPPTQRVELFGIIFVPQISEGPVQFVLKFWTKKISKGF